ncbi:MAG: VWA domain-containing protein [Deltaproteobacteria bacterium]|nr:VWA domain-containing protein [Deltaproteobacteria bacterium]
MRVWFIVFVLVAAAPVPAVAADSGCEYPNVMFVVDKSGSMSDPTDLNPSGDSKYEIALATIERALSLYGGKVRFGLTMFPWGDDDCGPGEILVAMDYDTSGSITGKMRAEESQPQGSTPIAATLFALAAEPSFLDASRRSFVLLLTDGEDTCASDADSPVKAAGDVFSKGTAVFVIGFGSGVDPVTLEAMASAGGTANAAQADGYFKADDAATLDVALTTIMESATAEVCDGRDNDCNGIADDVPPKRCSKCGIVGEQVCEAGEWTGCLDEMGVEITIDNPGCRNDSGGGFGDKGCACSSIVLE